MSTADTSVTKFPNVTVKLIGRDGNAFAILGAVQQGLRRGGATSADMEAFREEATSGDYDHLLATCMNWVNVT
jgi:hypothetical protein